MVLQQHISGILRQLQVEPFCNFSALNELNQIICLINDVSILFAGSANGMRGIFLMEIIKALEHCYTMNEESPETIALIVRALVNLLSLEGDGGMIAKSIISQENLIKSLCDHLHSIQYMDIAELVLVMLEKISKPLPSSIWKVGGLKLLLGFFDFFPESTQRIALSGAANICRKIPPEYEEMAKKEGFPTLNNLLSVGLDQKLLDQLCNAISRLIISLRNASDFGSLLKDSGIVGKIILMLSDLKLAESSKCMIKTLHCMLKACPSVAVPEILLNNGAFIAYFEKLTLKEDWDLSQLMLSCFLELYPVVQFGSSSSSSSSSSTSASSSASSSTLVNSESILSNMTLNLGKNAAELQQIINYVQNATGFHILSEDASTHTTSAEELKKKEEIFSAQLDTFRTFSQNLLSCLLDIKCSDPKFLFQVVLICIRISQCKMPVTDALRLFIINLFHSSELSIILAAFDLAELSFEEDVRVFDSYFA
jgi:hypothetical protein